MFVSTQPMDRQAVRNSRFGNSGQYKTPNHDIKQKPITDQTPDYSP